MNGISRDPVSAMTGPRRHRRLFICVACLSLLGVLSAGWLYWRHKPFVEPPAVQITGADPDLVQAIDKARAAIKASPASAAAWGQLGMIFLAHAMLPQAQECLAQAMQHDPQDGQWIYLHGLSLARIDPEACIPELEAAARLCQGEAAPRVRLGEILLSLDRLDEAEKQFGMVLQTHPGNAGAELGLGRVAQARGHWEKSLEHLKRSADRAPAVRATHAALAETHQRLGNKTAAGEELERSAGIPETGSWPDPYLEAVERQKTGVEARINLAQKVFQQGRVRDAISLVQETVRARPDSSAAHLGYARMLLQINKPSAAEGEFREAVSLRPDSAAAQAGLAAALQRQEKFSEAADAYRAAVRLNAQHSQSYYNLGLCLQQLGKKAEAVEALRAAVKCKPDVAVAHRQLAELLADMGKYKEAEIHLNDALLLVPSDELAQDILNRVRQQLQLLKMNQNPK